MLLLGVFELVRNVMRMAWICLSHLGPPVV